MNPKREDIESLPDEPEDGGATDELVAFLDGELDPQDNEVVEAKISRDPNVRAQADALKKTWELLDHLPRPEPTPNFTERTVSRIEPVGRSGSRVSANGPTSAHSRSAITPAQSAAATVTLPAPPPRRRLPALFTWFVFAALTGLLGYFVHAQIVRWDQQELDAKILSESRMLQDVQRYRYVDDLAFLQALDNPELFGEEPYVASGEVPK